MRRSRACHACHPWAPLLAMVALAVVAGTVHSASAASLPSALPFRVDAPTVALHGHETSLRLSFDGETPGGAAVFELLDPSGRILAATVTRDGEAYELSFVPERSGEHTVSLREGYPQSVPVALRVIPGWMTLLPPLLAIALALALRQVVPALIAGVWIGAWTVQGSPWIGLLRTGDRYVVGSLADRDHITIVIFSLLLGGMVGVMSRAGGTAGLVEALTPYATNTRRGQLVTWVLGILIFFDDYANTLLVGNTMRPVTDRLRISREKLAYVVDSTAAPVASIGIVTTWIGYEVSLIGDALPEQAHLDGYSVFLQSLPYNFYPLMALVFGLLVAITGRDLGPMRTAERRAAGGRVLADGAVPLADFDTLGLKPPPDKPARWLNAALPVASVLAVTFLGLWLLGRSALAASQDPRATLGIGKLGMQGIGAVFGAGDSYRALLYGSSAGCFVALILALGQRILTLGEGLIAWVDGIKHMTMAVIILTLAWAIGKVCEDLHTSSFLVDNLSEHLDPRWLPTLVFLLAAVTAFATGTSWTTMAILIPLAVSIAYGVGDAAGLAAAAQHRTLLATVSSVLAGAIFGDHCSPISDTTVMSSMASGCDHLDHVRTQLPYAMIVASISVVCGYLPAGFGLSPWLSLGLCSVTAFAILRWVGRPLTP